jgi:hypothetical protein
LDAGREVTNSERETVELMAATIVEGAEFSFVISALGKSAAEQEPFIARMAEQMGLPVEDAVARFNRDQFAAEAGIVWTPRASK